MGSFSIVILHCFLQFLSPGCRVPEELLTVNAFLTREKKEKRLIAPKILLHDQTFDFYVCLICLSTQWVVFYDKARIAKIFCLSVFRCFRLVSISGTQKSTEMETKITVSDDYSLRESDPLVSDVKNLLKLEQIVIIYINLDKAYV